MTVIAIKEHDYAQIRRKVGEAYDADPKFIRLLMAKGFIKLAEEPESATKPGRYKRRDMKADE